MVADHSLSGLRSARIRSGLGADILAACLGTTTRTYYRYETGKRLITWDKACILADTLGCSLDELRKPRPGDTVVAADTLAAWGTPEEIG